MNRSFDPKNAHMIKIATSLALFVALLASAASATGASRATASVGADYSSTGVWAGANYRIADNVRMKDACVGRVSISVSGLSKKRQSARPRLRTFGRTCAATWDFAKYPTARQEAVVRIRFKGNKFLKPIRFKRTAVENDCLEGGKPCED
jgi:hypothetical protein